MVSKKMCIAGLRLAFLIFLNLILTVSLDSQRIKVSESELREKLKNENLKGLTTYSFKKPNYEPYFGWEGHFGELITSITMSNDGKLLATGGRDGLIRIYDRQTDKLFRAIECYNKQGEMSFWWPVFNPRNKNVTTIAISPDGTKIAAGYYSHNPDIWKRDNINITVWNIFTGEIIFSKVGHLTEIRKIIFSKDGTRLATIGSSDDKSIKIWNMVDGKLLNTFTSQTSGLFDAVFLADGSFLTAFKENNGIIIKDDLGSKNILIKSNVNNLIELSNDGKILVTDDIDRNINIWSVSSGSLLKKLNLSGKSIVSFSISPDGSKLVSYDYYYSKDESTVKIWDITTGTELLSFKIDYSKTRNVLKFYYSPDGSQLLSNGIFGCIWSGNLGEIIKTYSSGSSCVEQVLYSQDDSKLYTRGNDGIKIWKMDSGLSYPLFVYDLNNVFSISRNEKQIAYVSERDVCVINSSDKVMVNYFPRISDGLGENGRYVYSLDFSPDGKNLISGGFDRLIKICDLEKNSISNMLVGHGDRVYSVKYSPDGTRIASGSHDAKVMLWDALEGKLIYIFHGHSSIITSVSFSPDGKQIVSSSYDTQVKIWDVESQTLKKTLIGHTAQVLSAIFSPDGSKIASAGNDGKIIIWDVKEGTKLFSFDFENGFPISLCFNKSGDKLAVGCDAYKNIRIYSIPKEIPRISLYTADEIRETSVKLSCFINPTGYNTSIFFELGTSPLNGTIIYPNPDKLIGNSEIECSIRKDSLQAGTLYFYRVNIQFSFGSFYTNWKSFITKYPNKLNINASYSFPDRKYGDEYNGTEYQIVGFPGNSNTLINQWLSGSQDKDWKVFSVDNNKLLKFDGSDKFRMSTGTGFLVLKKGNWLITENVQSAPLNNVQEFEIALNKGWNFITNPFHTTIKWYDIRNYNKIIEPLYTLKNSNSNYYFGYSDLLEPYKAYCLYSENDMILKIPYSYYFAPPSLQKENYLWKINVTLKRGEFEDKTLFFGVSSGPKEGTEKLKLRKPAFFGDQPSAYFLRPEWDKENPEFSTDIQPDSKKEYAWEISVKTEINQISSLSFTGIQTVPLEYDIYLIDSESGISKNLRQDSLYSFKPFSTINKFKVIAGLKENIKDKIKMETPTSYTLGPNYPNPFNPTTIIPVSIPAQSEIKLSIYNILGEEVKVLYSGIIPAGKYSFEWDGKDNNRNKLSSGIYFYKLSVKYGKTFLSKMILIK